MKGADYSTLFHAPGLEAWIWRVLNLGEWKRVLDVGSGMGIWGFLVEVNARYRGIGGQSKIAIEKEPWLIRSAPEYGPYDGLVLGSGTKLPFLDNSFDLVLAIEMHDSTPLAVLIEELLRVASKEKSLVIFAGKTTHESIGLLQHLGWNVYTLHFRSLVCRNSKTAAVRHIHSHLGRWRMAPLALGALILSKGAFQYVLAMWTPDIKSLGKVMPA